MSRSLNNQRCLFLLSALTALLWLLPVRSVRAAVYTYNARQRTINAGVLFVGSAADPNALNPSMPGPYVSDPAPYVFYVLDQRADVKPVGWSFVNPLAQSTVTTAMITRWNGAYKTGQSLTPTMASYWEVALRDVSADDLQQFDVLYLAAPYVAGGSSYGVTFTPADNEKLRRFVDNGGQLLVEYGAATPTQLNFNGVLPLFVGATWATGTDNSLAPNGAPGSFDLHPLLTQPYFLSQQTDFPFLGGSSLGAYGTIMPVASSDYANLFSTVLSHANGLAVTAAQLGGGQVVTSTLNLGPTVSGPPTGAVLGAFYTSNPASVAPANFKFLSNMISWADAHPTENKTSHQNAAGPSSASFTAAWSYPDPAQGRTLGGSTAPPGAAVWGDYVYVTDSMGMLRAFDAIPDEALTAGTSADDGLPNSPDFGITTAPTPYDEVWHMSVGAGASAPTVGSYGGNTFVFVEKVNGSVVQYKSVTGELVNTLMPPASGPAMTYPQPGAVNAPAPTYYDGRIYAGQPDGTLFVFSLNGMGSAGINSGVTGAVIPVNPQTVTGEYATASPAVGLLASGSATNSIVALVPTTQNMNTVLLGARNDPLVSHSPNGQFAGYNVNRNARYNLPNLFVDVASMPAGRAYDSFGTLLASAGGQGQDPAFPATLQPSNVEDQFGDWDIDFVKSIPPNSGLTLTLHEIKALSLANTLGGPATLSAPAIDRHGDYYYVVNAGDDSYLFGVHDDIMQANVRLKFRFRLPKTPKPGDISTVNPINGTQWSSPGNAFDADNVNYANTTTNPDGSSRSLLDYHFVGAPVVDGQGNVYVAAQYVNPNSQKLGPAAVLSFNADREITAEPRAPTPASFDATAATYFQNDETSPYPQNPLAATPSDKRQARRIGQITTAGSQATVFNFGRSSGGSRQIAGNLSEPQPFTAVPSGPNGGVAMWMYFHTNLAWYATFAVNGQISGLSKAGNTLMLCDSGNAAKLYNTLYKLPAAPTVGVGKLAALTVRKAPLGTGANGKSLSIGAVTAAPSAGGGAMVVNGVQGIAAFNQQLTLIADNNRILEVDADGSAVWSADATTRAAGNGVSTKVDFAHPSALAQFAPNDYLVADTGNNRCVRFDRAGNVVWELTRFYDPSGLMAPGQPYTLSQLTSVEVRREQGPNYTDPVTGKPQTMQLVHYLVADSGNDRIVEVTDTLDPAGNVLYFDTNTPANVVLPGTSGSVTHDHLLTWVTHTGDKYGRRYHYAGASYLGVPSGSAGVAGTIEVFALVTNTRVATPTLVSAAGVYPPVYALAPASGDAPGGSIVAFLLPAPQKAFSDPTLTNDLAYVATSFTAPVSTGTGASAVTTILTFPVRNPRFLHVYAPPQNFPASGLPYAYSFLYADDNGAFDLVYRPPGTSGQPTPPISYGLAFTQTNYRAMTVATNTPPLTADPALDRTRIPFVPTCVQRLNNDNTNTPVTSHIERYLITQSYSQGELARLPGSPATVPYRLGGEIFEVDVSTTVSGGVTTAVTQDPVGGFAGAVTLSRPVGASPLTQPTFAIRTAQ